MLCARLQGTIFMGSFDSCDGSWWTVCGPLETVEYSRLIDVLRSKKFNLPLYTTRLHMPNAFLFIDYLRQHSEALLPCQSSIVRTLTTLTRDLTGMLSACIKRIILVRFKDPSKTALQREREREGKRRLSDKTLCSQILHFGTFLSAALL